MKNLIKLLSFLFFISFLFLNVACDVNSPEEEKALVDTDYDDNSGLDTLKAVTMSDAEIDSLFDVLVKRTILIEDVNSADDIINLNFKELSDAFGSAVKADTMHVKANVGFIVASVLALNSNSDLIKVADSLDAYFSGLDTYLSESDRTRNDEKNMRLDKNVFSRIFSKRKHKTLVKDSYSSNGMTGMSVAILSRMPEIAMRQTDIPSFPKFLTISHVQDIIEASIVPVLTNVINAFERIESGNSDVIFTVERDTVELDKSDFYIIDAGVRLLRSTLSIFTAYEWDIYTSSSDQSYSWIDEVFKMGEESVYHNIYTYSMEEDVVIETKYNSGSNDEELFGYMYDITKYNYERSSFLKLKRANHNRAYRDLLSAVEKLKSAITSLESETDNQDNDLIKKVDFDDLKSDFVDMQQVLLDAEFSSQFAANFKSPRALLNFIENVLENPYTFSETIDSVKFEMTVDLSKFFTNPIEDFKQHYPKYKFRAKSNMMEVDTFSWSSSSGPYPNNTVYIDTDADSVIIDIPESKIDYISGNIIYLKDSYASEEGYSLYNMYYPIDLIDDNGKVLDYDLWWEDEADGGWILPYYNDYTINGIFPGMTREKWTDLVEQFEKLFIYEEDVIISEIVER